MTQTLHRKAMLATIVTLAWPTIIEQALQTVVQYADAAMVGRLGAEASASVGLTTTVMWLVNSPFFAMGIGVLACISRSLGAKDVETAQKATVQALFLTIWVGIFMGIATLAVSPFLPLWLGAEPEIRHNASLYFGITCLPMLFRSSSIILGTVLRAAGDTKTPMLVNAVMNLINVLLNFLLIYDTRTLTLFGVSFTLWGGGLGVVGAAIATAIAYTFGGLLMFWRLYRHPLLSPRGKRWKIDKPILFQCVRVGMPVALERMTACLGQVVFGALVTSLGTLSLAAHSIAITAEQAFYIPGYGMQAAAATLSGNALGERDEKKLDHMSRTIMFMAVVAMAIGGAFLFCFPQWVMGLFTTDPAVIERGAAALRIVAVSEPIFAAVIILEGIFNGVGDTKNPFIYSVISMWGVRILCTFLCVKVFGFGLSAVWACMVADNTCRFLLLGSRYFTGRFKVGLDLQPLPTILPQATGTSCSKR